MGYDMRWRKVDESEKAAVAGARDIWNAAIRARNSLPDGEQGQLNMDRAKASGDFEAHENYDGRSDRYRQAQDAVMEASRLQDEAEQSYFRLNIFGMGRWRNLMYELGMIFDAAEQPEWPDIESFGVTWDDVERVEYADDDFYKDKPPVGAETQEKAKRYIAERDRLLAWHGQEVPGIPAHKFGSNDGWIVLPAECKAALAIYMAKLEEIGRDSMDNLIDNTTRNRGHWAKWLLYLQGAIAHDGFEVH